VSIQPELAIYFLDNGKPSLSILRYLIQFLQHCSFVDCGFRVMVSSRIRVSVSFSLFCIFTVLHGMQTRSCDENSVRPSVRETRAL